MSSRAPEHFLPSARLIRFRNTLIRKTRPQLAANHVDADSFNLKPPVFILMQKNVGAGSNRAGGAFQRPVLQYKVHLLHSIAGFVRDLEGLQGCTCSPHFVF